MTTSPSPIEPRHRRAGRIPVSLTSCVLDGSAGVPPAFGSTRNCQRCGRDAHAPGKAPKHGCARRAFTLVELLLVISIISIILGMLVSTVRAVRRFSRQTITRGEIKNIEAAWKQFYAHYQYWPWPSAAVINTVTRVDENGDVQYELLAPLARMLEGSNITDIVDDPAGITTYNADKIAFLELSRFNGTDPVNAWGRNYTISGLGKTPNTYVVIFDANGDNQITVSLPDGSETNIFRSVAVWTENPEYSVGTAAGDGPQHYFGSWME
jgi:prepilin-type N-terminal cleavage/methylation domain-containing protein